MVINIYIFFFQAEDGIRDSVASRGLGDVYKRQSYHSVNWHLNQVNSQVVLTHLVDLTF